VQPADKPPQGVVSPQPQAVPVNQIQPVNQAQPINHVQPVSQGQPANQGQAVALDGKVIATPQKNVPADNQKKPVQPKSEDKADKPESVAKGEGKPEPKSEAKADSSPGKGEKSEKQDKGRNERVAKSAAGAGRFARLMEAEVLRHQMRTELYKEALSILRENPSAADVPACGSGAPTLCVPATVEDAASKAATAAQDTLAQVAGQAGSLLLPATPVRRKVAYLIGNNDYRGAIPVLETPIADVEAISEQLGRNLGYEVNLVRNASKADIILTLKKAVETAARDESVLIMYAGHGYQMDDTKQGYWIPVDASHKSPEKWVSNSDITKFMSAIPAKQVILISDSCFSGTLAKEQKITTVGGDKREILARRSVLVMSSGGEEPVSDEGKEGHSIFAYTLIKQLKKVNDFTTGSQVFENVRTEVSAEFPQEPQLGAVTSAGHVMGGDYLFEINQMIRRELK
jgi:hypothetical protein